MNETVKADLTSPDIACKYDFKVDLNNDNLAHTLIVKLVGENKEVLDVGCATGYLDRVFVENGCTVTGIEVSEEAAQLARRYCKQVFTADLEEFNWGALRDHRFDVILFGDVLEHLKNPAKVLLDASASLASDGYVVASIPNVAHASLRL